MRPKETLRLLDNLETSIRILEEAAVHGNVTVIIVKDGEPRASDLQDLLSEMRSWTLAIRAEVTR